MNDTIYRALVSASARSEPKPTHVEVQCIKFRDAVLRDELRYRRISLAHPAEELGYTHLEESLCRAEGVEEEDTALVNAVRSMKEAPS